MATCSVKSVVKSKAAIIEYLHIYSQLPALPAPMHMSIQLTPRLEGGYYHGDMPTLIKFGGSPNAVTPSSLPGPLVAVPVVPLLMLSLLLSLIVVAPPATLLFPGLLLLLA